MAREQFEASLVFILKWEASVFTNHPDDHGGPTRYGVIQREYDRHRQAAGLPPQSVKFISMDEVRAIYRREYWGRLQCDDMPSPLELVLFDTGILMGTGRSAKLLQATLGVEVDGVIGSNTQAAVAEADPREVAEGVMDRRETRLHAIVNADPSQQTFLRGWLNRLNDLRSAVAGSAELGVRSAEEAAGSDEAAPFRAMGRAERDLPEDRSEGGSREAPKLRLFEPMSVADFRTSSRRLLGSDSTRLYVVDPRFSSDAELRCFHPGDKPELSFDIPSIAIDNVVPLGVYAGDPGCFTAALAFKPGFLSLIDTFQRLASALRRPAQAGGLDAGIHAADAAGARTETQRATRRLELADVFAEARAGTAASAGWKTRRAEPDVDDPASPQADEINETSDLATARSAANLGASSLLDEAESELERSTDESGARATLSLDIREAGAFLDACRSASPPVAYGLGAKVPFFGAIPGRDFRQVDCSGFVREAIRRATNRQPFPDGSVVQHDWVRARGYEKASTAAGSLEDGGVRIAFLRPQDAPSGIGHVALVYNGRTLESHSGVGPNSRTWSGTGWQQKAHVYTLAPPQ